MILVAALAVLTLTAAVASSQDGGIIVNGADVILTPPVSASAPPVDVEVRVVVEYANDVQRMDLVAMSATPPVPERVVVEYANVISRKELAAPPGGLQAALDGVPERIVFQYANANLHFALGYPLEVIDDPTPPQIIEIVPLINSTSMVSITWTTDEFADSQVLYGEEPGQYPQTVSDPLFVKEHEVALTGLTPETTYYFRARSTDLSGNTTTSPEYSFVPIPDVPDTNLFVYLPLVVRNGP